MTKRVHKPLAVLALAGCALLNAPFFPLEGFAMEPSDLQDFATDYAAAWSSQDPERLASFYGEDGVLIVNGEGGMETAGISAAEKWVDLVDQHKYAESWTEASAYFRNAVARQEWAKTLEGVRAPLGGVVSRTLDGASYQTNLPGAPDGEYVIVKFRTEFRNKREAVETVVPMKEQDGSWRVSGYFIR